MDERLVHLVDDDASFQRSAAFLLRTSGFTVQVWSSGDAFLRELRTIRPGCILLDVRMPGIDGTELLSLLSARGVGLPVIMVTGHGDVPLAVRAMQMGALDFLLKPFERAALLSALELGFLRLADRSVAELERVEAERLLAALTERELEVLGHLARGRPNKVVAHDLGISTRTVEVHRSHAMAKLAARSFADALRIAFAAGLHQS